MKTMGLFFVITFLALCAYSQTNDDLIFIHHSCGQNWLNSGLHDALDAKDYIDERNDISYGTPMEPDSGRPKSLGDIPGDNTNMNHWILWFNDYLKGIKTQGCASGKNRIIMFKSCFPISNIYSAGKEPGDPFVEEQNYANYKSVFRHPDGAGHTYEHDGFEYKALDDIFAENPATLFIVITAPPRHYAPVDGSTDDEAHRTRLFNNWLKGTWLSNYNNVHPGLNNVAVFDWFYFLAYSDDHSFHPNRLKKEYGGENGDSHPNDTANNESTIVFATATVNFIDQAWRNYIITVAVQLTAFAAEQIGETIAIKWNTEYEVNTLGFNLYRSVGTSDNYYRLNKDKILSKGNSLQGSDYSFIDRDIPESGIYYYLLEEIEQDGKREQHGPISINYSQISSVSTLPQQIKLFSNFPNPFNASTTISFALTKTDKVRIDIYTISGEKITTLTNDVYQAGLHQLTWEADNMNSGMYLIVLQTGKFFKTEKAVLIK